MKFIKLQIKDKDTVEKGSDLIYTVLIVLVEITFLHCFSHYIYT